MLAIYKRRSYVLHLGRTAASFELKFAYDIPTSLEAFFVYLLVP
jgi:hypothetical protein